MVSVSFHARDSYECAVGSRQSALSDERGRASPRFGVNQRNPGSVSERERERCSATRERQSAAALCGTASS